MIHVAKHLRGQLYRDLLAPLLTYAFVTLTMLVCV